MLEVAARHGVVVQLEAGRPIMRAASAPPAEIVALLRQHREAVGALLARRASEQDVAPGWPEGVDYWLTKDAAEISGIVNTGGTGRVCSNGGLDMWRENGLYRGFAPDLVRRLREVGLLPEGLG
ncbi:hypothetical protein [Sediminicoccus sp. KRV36]|uniref:hypothetical protein n=1 Tax=Sediminicoccus sp. KRV36 TaxID=3133721 RepID=UPI00200C3F84|nr:hypothetical protein [Sediminicoccus rosea]UPY35427.1 hypothetical protein LHU95_14505 [Sediminicoccus rosea]